MKLNVDTSPQPDVILTCGKVPFTRFGISSLV